MSPCTHHETCFRDRGLITGASAERGALVSRCVPFDDLVKLPAHRAGLPGNERSFLIVPLDPAYKAGLAGHLPVEIRWQSKKLQIQGAQILRNEAYLQYAAVTKDAAQRSPSALLRAMSLSNGPSALLKAMSMSNGSWTFYEAIKFESLDLLW